MYQQVAILIVACVGLSQASYLAGPLAAPLPLAAPAHFTTAAHVGNVQSVARSYSSVPQSRFTRTDWNQPGSLITAPVYSPIISPVLGQIAVPGPTRYESFLVPRAPLVENIVSHVPGVAHVPAVAHVPVAAPAPLPYAAGPIHAVKGY